MSRYEEAIARTGIDRIIDEQYGQWGHINEPAIEAIWMAASQETEPYFRITLASMLAVTVMNECTFDITVKPNTNSKDKPSNLHCPAAWDFGPCQINFFWNVLETWEGNVRMRGLGWRDVFGRPPYLPNEPFTGNPVMNMRAAIRIMLSKKPDLDKNVPDASPQETQVVHYTGGDQERKDHRRADWRKYSPLFQEFFEEYR